MAFPNPGNPKNAKVPVTSTMIMIMIMIKDNENDIDRMIIFRKEKEKVWTTTPSCSLPRRPFQNMTSMSLAPSIKRFKHDHHICKAYRYMRWLC